MKASQYREAHRRYTESGVHDTEAYTHNEVLENAWDALDVQKIKLGAGYRLYTDLNEFLRKEKVVPTDAKFSHKLAAFLSGPEARLHKLPHIKFGDIVHLFERYGAGDRAFDVVARLFSFLGQVPPLSKAEHSAYIEAQRVSMGPLVERTGRNVFTEALKKRVLRPLLKTPRVVSSRLAGEEAYRRQNFLDDGTPAGVQHVLNQQALERNGGRIKLMGIETKGAGIPRESVDITKISEELSSLISRGIKKDATLTLKEKLQLNAISSGSSKGFNYVAKDGSSGNITCEVGVTGRSFNLNGVQLQGVFIPSNVQQELSKMWETDKSFVDFEQRLESEVNKIASNNTGEIAALRTLLTGDPWVNYPFRILTGELNGDEFAQLLRSYKNAEQTEDTQRTHRALTALAVAVSFGADCADVLASPFQKEKLSNIPRVLNKILAEGKKYNDKKEKDYVLSLLALADGSGRMWGKQELVVLTESTGVKIFSSKDAGGTVRSFSLTKDEQEKLKDAGLETGPEKEIEGMRLAILEIQNRLSKIERDSTIDGLDPEKKARNAQYIDLLLKEELTFPGVYYVRDTKKPKSGERAKDKRVKVSFLKNVSADAVTISGSPIDGYDGPIPNVIIEKAKLVALKAKFEGKKTEDLKKPAELGAALGVLSTWDKTKYFDNDAQRAVLDTYLKPLFDSAHRPAKIGEFDVTDDTHSFKFEKGGRHAFTIAASQVALWRDISAVPKPSEPPRLPPLDALPAGVLEQSIVGTDGWEDELGRRVGTKLLMGKLKMEQGEISKEKALDYVKGLGFWKRMGLYAALALGTAAVAIGASYLIGAGIAASIGWGAAFSLKWYGLMGLKIAATAGVAFGANKFLRKKWLDKRYGLIGTKGEPSISFMERSKDAAGYYRALKEFRKDKKAFDTKEGKLARARNHVRSSGTPEFVAAKYQMGMDTVMAHHETGARNERTRQFLIPIAIGGGIAGATAYYHWDIIKSLMPGSRPPSGALPPTTGRGGPPPLTRGGQPPVPQGPRFVQDRFGRWILPNSGQYIEVYCGAPRATCIPCDFTINGTRAHWYINSFADSMSVASPKGGMSYLLGNMNTIPGGRVTQEQVWSLFERTLCADRDLYRTFYNVGNSSKGRWIDFAVLKETTWVGGRKQAMIDVMIDRAGNENVRSTLRAMRESILQNNPRLSVRLAR